MSWRTPVSRCGVLSVPCRYLLATILMAVMDQSLGDSTSFCSKIVLPLASVMLAVRSSHSTSSQGETPARVKCRGNSRPGACFCCVGVCFVVCVVFVINSAISSSWFSRVVIPRPAETRNPFSITQLTTYSITQCLKSGRKQWLRRHHPVHCSFGYRCSFGLRRPDGHRLFEHMRGSIHLRVQPGLERFGRLTALACICYHRVAQIASGFGQTILPCAARSKQPAQSAGQAFRFVDLKDSQHAARIRSGRLHNLFRQGKDSGLLRHQQKSKTGFTAKPARPAQFHFDFPP